MTLDLADPSDATGTGPTDELAAHMHTLRQEPGVAAELEQHLTELLGELPPAQRAALAPDAAAQRALTNRLAEEAARLVTARMKGSAE